MASQKAIQLATKIINGLKNHYEIDYLPSDFYAGITNNVARRMKEHNAEGYYIDCYTYECACEVESLLAREGFKVGKRAANGGADDSRFVYVYCITPLTIEDTNA